MASITDTDTDCDVEELECCEKKPSASLDFEGSVQPAADLKPPSSSFSYIKKDGLLITTSICIGVETWTKESYFEFLFDLTCICLRQTL